MRHAMRSLGLLVLLASGCARPTSASRPVASDEAHALASGEVRTASGVVRGSRAADGYVFRGIPYARASRFRAPEPPTAWTGVREATAFAPRCPQIGRTGAVVGEEDCLAVNVWTPALAPREPMPVIVFVHGGANIAGSTQDTTMGGASFYDGARLATRTRAVVVTTSYRLGALGFLASPMLEGAHGASGNYGLADLIAALRWTQANAGAFGGDPARVTLMGQSAGAHDACALLASPAAKGLFSGVWMASERCSVAPAEKVEARDVRVVRALGCADAACLRARPFAEVVLAVPGSHGVEATTQANPFYYELTAGGALLPESPLDALAAGHVARVPLVLSTTADETSLQIMRLGKELSTDEDLVAYATKQWGKHVAEVLAAYPRATFASAREALVAMTTDERFTCPARRIARAALRGGRAKPYRVVFALGHDHDGYRPYGAYHGVDLNYAFGVLDTPKQPATPFEREASARWMDAIGAFAATGRPPFRPYDASGVVTVFGREAQAEPDHAAARCDVWDAVPTLH